MKALISSMSFFALSMLIGPFRDLLEELLFLSRQVLLRLHGIMGQLFLVLLSEIALKLFGFFLCERHSKSPLGH
jgi:hypothetical protein